MNLELILTMDLLCRLTKRAWSGMSDSNRRPSDPKSDALPSCANSGWRWLEDSNFYRIINTTLVFETSLLPIRVNQQFDKLKSPRVIYSSAYLIDLFPFLNSFNWGKTAHQGGSSLFTDNHDNVSNAAITDCWLSQWWI